MKTFLVSDKGFGPQAGMQGVVCGYESAEEAVEAFAKYMRNEGRDVKAADLKAEEVTGPTIFNMT